MNATVDPLVAFNNLGERVGDLAVENATQAATIQTLRGIVHQLQEQNAALRTELEAAQERAQAAEDALWEQNTEPERATEQTVEPEAAPSGNGSEAVGLTD